MNMQQPDGLQISRKVWKKAISPSGRLETPPPPPTTPPPTPLRLPPAPGLVNWEQIHFSPDKTTDSAVAFFFSVVFFLSLISTDADAGGDDKLLLRCSQYLATERNSSRAKSCLVNFSLLSAIQVPATYVKRSYIFKR